jgi:hypothetical protein
MRDKNSLEFEFLALALLLKTQTPNCFCDPKRPNFELFGRGFGAFVKGNGITIIVIFDLSNETFD